MRRWIILGAVTTLVVTVVAAMVFVIQVKQPPDRINLGPTVMVTPIPESSMVSDGNASPPASTYILPPQCVDPSGICVNEPEIEEPGSTSHTEGTQ